MRWLPIRGCEDLLTAMIRASGLADDGVDGGGFWEGKTRVALQALLHAAAIDHRTPAELFRWTLDPSAAADAVAILNASPDSATGWAEGLEAMIETDPRTRDSSWQGVSLALAALADPRVLDSVRPGEDEAFDPEAFIRAKGTLYLLATGAGAGNRAAFVAAFVEALVEDRTTHGNPFTGCPAGPARAAGVGRDREPRPATVTPNADGRRRRYRHHHYARTLPSSPSTRFGRPISRPSCSSGAMTRAAMSASTSSLRQRTLCEDSATNGRPRPRRPARAVRQSARVRTGMPV